MPSIYTFSLILLTLFLFACKHQEDVTVYKRYKEEDGSFSISSLTYRINAETQMVIRLADSRGAVEKYSDCTVQDSQNWYCDTVEFSLGEQTKNRFGFDQGQYFNFDERRDLSDIRVFYISNWEYWYYKIREYIR